MIEYIVIEVALTVVIILLISLRNLIEKNHKETKQELETIFNKIRWIKDEITDLQAKGRIELVNDQRIESINSKAVTIEASLATCLEKIHDLNKNLTSEIYEQALHCRVMHDNRNNATTGKSIHHKSKTDREA